MESVSSEPLCAKEALDLLNCAAESPFDRDKCLRFLDALRNCLKEKKVKKFSLAGRGQPADSASSTKEKY